MIELCRNMLYALIDTPLIDTFCHFCQIFEKIPVRLKTPVKSYILLNLTLFLNKSYQLGHEYLTTILFFYINQLQFSQILNYNMLVFTILPQCLLKFLFWRKIILSCPSKNLFRKQISFGIFLSSNMCPLYGIRSTI